MCVYVCACVRARMCVCLREKVCVRAYVCMRVYIPGLCACVVLAARKKRVCYTNRKKRVCYTNTCVISYITQPYSAGLTFACEGTGCTVCECSAADFFKISRQRILETNAGVLCVGRWEWK